MSLLQSCFFWNFTFMITTCIIFERIFFILTRGKKLKTSLSAINNKKQHSLPCSHQAKGQCQAELMSLGAGAHLISGQARKWGGGSSLVSTEGLEKRCLWQLHSENKLSSEIFIVCHNFKVFLYIISYLIVSTTLGYLYLLVCRVEH